MINTIKSHYSENIFTGYRLHLASVKMGVISNISMMNYFLIESQTRYAEYSLTTNKS
ncbi:Uncharacterised protein [Salmonella enterica]|uniref:Uncharacterized protein n=1 Tax=Salmonella enterica TaxID=28901 RepID=A0A379QPQ1_SALER|nr:Uncharacterised protein [Salmonella enterica]